MKDGQSDTVYRCEICDTTFTRSHNYMKHNRRFHGAVKDRKNNLPVYEYHFYSDHDFAEWKAKIEEETSSSFVKRSGLKKLGTQETVQYYYCHRGGAFTPAVSSRKRQLKRAGSIKIGKVCPAKIVVHRRAIDCAAELSVKFSPNHANHEFDPARLTLSRQEKEFLASQLHCGVPKSQVLKNLEHAFDPTRRLSLTTRKDLHNISAIFKIEQNLCIHPDDAAAVDEKVAELQATSATTGSSPVLIYKKIHEINVGMQEFEGRDFILGIMMEPQVDLLALHGNRIIQIDSTPFTNDYGYLLTVVLVYDISGEILPVAILYSSCQNIHVFESFFFGILNRLTARNKTISPSVLITDDTPLFAEAWKNVFGLASVHMMSEWHVKKSFRRLLTAKILDTKMRAGVGKELDALVAQIDEMTFKEELRTLCEKWANDETTRAFVEHFQENYLNRTHQWARCYRLSLGVNVNAKIEGWRRLISKQNPSTGPDAVKRMDRSLKAMLELIDQKLVAEDVKPDMTSLPTAPMSDQERHHAASLDMASATILETEPGRSWIIPSAACPITSNNLLEACQVFKISDTCELNCNVQCEPCKSCVHMYKCTCNENRAGLVMCKHIHRICQVGPEFSQLVRINVAEPSAQFHAVQMDVVDQSTQFQGTQIDVADQASQFHQLQMVNDHQMALVPQEAGGAIHIQLVQQLPSESVEVRRANLTTKLQMAMEKVEFATSHEEMDILDQLLDAFIANLDIWSSGREPTQLVEG